MSPIKADRLSAAHYPNYARHKTNPRGHGHAILRGTNVISGSGTAMDRCLATWLCKRIRFHFTTRDTHQSLPPLAVHSVRPFTNLVRYNNFMTLR